MLPLKNSVPLLCILLIVSISARAQFKFGKAVLLNKENGLPGNAVGPLSKSEDGFIWIGGSEGLYRFDGLQVRTFQEGSDPEHSLFDNSVFAILPVHEKIWVGTSQGISVLNTRNYTFKHYQLDQKGKSDSLKRRFDQQVSVLHLDRDGKIWVGTTERGVAVYHEDRDDFQFFQLPEGGIRKLSPSLGTYNSILSITESINNDSIIWAGTTAGLQEINKFNGTTRLYTFPQPGKDYQVALNAFRRLYHHTDGLLYVGSWGAGVNVFDPVAATFTPLEVKSPVGKEIVKKVISNLHYKSDHEIWISTIDGLAIYDTHLKDITWFARNNAAENEFYFINYIDESNRVWYTGVNGVGYYDPVVQQFSKYSFRHLSKPDWAFVFYTLTNPTGNIITVCPRITDGIFFYDRSRREWSKESFPQKENFLGEREAVKGFVELSPGEYVLSSDKGVYRYSRKTKKLSMVRPEGPFAPTRRGDMIRDRDGNIWLSDYTWGLTKWYPKTNRVISYREQTQGAETPGHFNRLLALYEDSRGNIWFQRAGGIGVYRSDKDTFLNFNYSVSEKNSFPAASGFSEDRMGRVWVNSIDGWIGYGLSSEPERGVVYKMNIHSKGIAGKFARISSDPEGNVWGFNQKELVRINASDLSFNRFSFQYGAGDADFFHFSFLPTGELIFGGRNDIVIANPADLKRNTEIPDAYITDLQILNQPANNFLNGEPLSLRYRQNFFSIGFSAKAYTLSREVKFRYRLKGFDDWSEPTQRRFANYTNVPGGDYVFQLQAANNEGTWNPVLCELPVHIATAFWQTLWFRILALLLLGGIVYGVYRYRVNQFRKKEKLKSEYEKKIANVEMSSLLAQMNPHFLFNSLNSIDSYIIRNESGKASEYLNNFARLMRLILQNSRSNYITLKDELEALELYMQMEGLRFRDKFEYSVKVGEGIDTSAIVIPPMLIQPYVENAIWHGLMHKHDGTKGKVEIIISTDDHKLKCVVQDNGIGRDKAEEIKAGKSGNRKRSMGMQITRDRIDMINKMYGSNTKVEITDLADPGGKPAGTRVELTIPY